jgi:CheY-like chemotaxis protein
MSEINTRHVIYKKVLIVDDNEIDLYIAEQCIQNYNFAGEVVLMDSAKKAIDYLLSLKNTPDELPELIFLDINMPGVTGFGFLEEYEKFPEIIKEKSAIMMLSSSLNRDDEERALKNKFVNKYLNKPLNKEKLGII